MAWWPRLTPPCTGPRSRAAIASQSPVSRVPRRRRRPAPAPTTARAPALHDLVADPATHLLTTIRNTPGGTGLREVLQLGHHNAYHVGEFAFLRQVMVTWPPGREE